MANFQPKRPTVSVVIPTLNEAHNLPLVLPYLPLSWIDEVLLVDGRSTDGTIEVARRLLPSIRIVLEKRKGKGIAMRTGFATANGDILITMDADGSNDPREIPIMIERLLEGADFVKGSRFAPGGGTTDMPAYRKWGNWGLGALVNLLFNGNYTDLCYGYHAFWRHCLPTIDRTIADGFEVDTAIYIRLLRDRLRVAEVPSFEGYRFHGVGKLQTLPDGFRILGTILREYGQSLRMRREDVYLGFRGYQPPSVALGKSDVSPLELIYNLSHEMAALPDPTERLAALLRRVLNIMTATSGSVVLLEEDGTVKNAVVATSEDTQSLHPVQAADILRSGLAGWVVQYRQAALIPSTLEDPRWLRRPWETGRSALSVPLMLFDRAFGVMTLVQDHVNQFNNNDLALLTAITVGLSLSSTSVLLADQVPQGSALHKLTGTEANVGRRVNSRPPTLESQSNR